MGGFGRNGVGGNGYRRVSEGKGIGKRGMNGMKGNGRRMSNKLTETER